MLHQLSQAGPPHACRPATTFVAGFLGSPPMNLLPATIADGRVRLGGTTLTRPACAPDGPVTLGVRPEDLVPAPEGPLAGEVVAVEPLGAETILSVRLPGVERELMLRAGRSAPAGLGERIALVAPHMQAGLGQPVLVENRPGAGGTVAAEAVARAAPDGYTLFMTTVSTQAIAPNLRPDIRYDPDRDFAPISLIARVPLVLLVPPALGITDVKGLIDLLRREPGRHAYASSGVGAPLHLAGELFRQRTGVDAIHVPYRGSAPALTDLVAGRVTFMFDALPPAVPFIADGRLVALGVGTLERARARPEIPTMQEAGVEGFEAYTWAAFYAPGGTPAPIVARLHAEVSRAARQPDVTERMQQLGYELVVSTPAELAAFQRREHEKWGEVIRRGNISIEN